MRLRYVLATTLLAAGPAFGQNLNLVTGVSVKDEGGVVVLSVTGTKPPNFTTFSMADPPRFVIDLSEAKFRGVPEDMPADDGLILVVKNLSYGSDTSSIARIMVAFAVDVDPPDVQTQGSTLVVRIAKPAGAAAAMAQAARAAEQRRAQAEVQAKADAQARAEQEARAREAADQAAANRRAQEELDARARAEEQEKLAAAARARELAAPATAPAAGAAPTVDAPTVDAAADARAKEDAERQRLEATATAQVAADQKKQEAAERKAEADRMRQEAAEKKAEAKRQRDEAIAAAKAAADQKKQEAAEKRAEAKRQRDEAIAAAKAGADQKKQEAAEKKAEAKRQRDEAIATAKAEADRKRQEAAERKAEASRARQESLAATAPSQVRELGFKQIPGASRVFLRTSAPPRFTIQDVGENMIRVEVENARAPHRNDMRFLDTSFFPSAIAMITPSRRGSTYVLDIRLRQKVPYQQKIEGDMLALDFERPGTALAPAAAEAPAEPAGEAAPAAAEPAAR